MDLEYLEKLVKIFETSTLTELEIDEEGGQVRLSRMQEPAAAGPSFQYAMPAYGGGMPLNGAPQPAASAVPAQASTEASSSGTQKKLHEVKSPIVGTIYRAPAPDADPYVQVGQHVDVGTTLCIIEAMKLMNEIESDAAGTIVKILVENGQPVEYGQVLMLVE